MELRVAIRKVLSDLPESLWVVGATRVPLPILRCPRHEESLWRVAGPLQIWSMRRLYARGDPPWGHHDTDPAASVGRQKLSQAFQLVQPSGARAGLTFR